MTTLRTHKAGRPPKALEIGRIRELTLDEVGKAGRAPKASIKQLRDSHHLVARLFAMGMRPGEIAKAVGYTLMRINQLYTDPAMQELIAHYRGIVQEQFVDHAAQAYEDYAEIHAKTRRQTIDQLDEADESGEKIPLRTLLSLTADAADRLGYAKRSVSVNVNLEFASRLDRAIARADKAKEIEAAPRAVSQLLEGEVSGPVERQDSVGPPIRRRA